MDHARELQVTSYGKGCNKALENDRNYYYLFSRTIEQADPVIKHSEWLDHTKLGPWGTQQAHFSKFLDSGIWGGRLNLF